ncbi:hypothetical protein L2E82_11403 [Cichorium intybus]|uniref:Uncharacterized protein n=1 Tax=Cichorium intybus TaxID=13427 RepID=A0ACB9GE92_CICIN|nr:hypothetical protein L2E82_11403 [Cichorium intybus]
MRLTDECTVNCNCKACKLVAIFQSKHLPFPRLGLMSTILPWVIGLVGGVVLLFGIACAFVLYMCYLRRLRKSRIRNQQWKLQSFHQLGFSEIDKATNKFDEAQVIGEGAFGKVYYGKRKDGTPVAIKRGSGRHGQGKKEFKAEIEMLLRHLIRIQPGRKYEYNLEGKGK